MTGAEDEERPPTAAVPPEKPAPGLAWIQPGAQNVQIQAELGFKRRTLREDTAAAIGGGRCAADPERGRCSRDGDECL